MSSYQKVASMATSDKHTADVPVLLFCCTNMKNYSVAEMMVWNSDLKLEKTIEAHPLNVYNLTASDKFLYSCSNNNTIKVCNIETFELVKSIDSHVDTEVLKLFYADDKLYAGDDVRNILVLQHDDIVGQYGVLEEVTGLCAKDNYLYTTGQHDFTISEMKPGNKTQFEFCTRKCESGHGPVCLTYDKVFFVNTDGCAISVTEANPGCKNLAILKGHEMINNALNGNESFGVLYSGGYDKVFKAWDINTFQNTASVPIGNCVHAITSGNNQVFISTSDGDR